MSGKSVVVPVGSAVELLRGASSLDERMAAGRAIMELVELPQAKVPVPRFLGDLPWQTDNGDVVDQIILNLMVSEDIERASEGSTPLKASDVLNQWLVIHDLRVNNSDVEDSVWRAYYSIDVELEDGRRLVLNTGARQVMATLWRVYVDGMLPCWGKFTEIGESKTGRSAPLAVIVKSKLPGSDEQPF